MGEVVSCLDQSLPKSGGVFSRVLHQRHECWSLARRQTPRGGGPRTMDEELALEYVYYVCTEAKVGDYASPAGVRRLTLSKQLGRPLAPRTMNDKLSAMSRMFTDWQTRFHVIDGTPARKIDLPFL